MRIFLGAITTTSSSCGALMIWASVSWADAGAGSPPPLPPIRPPSSSQTQPGGTGAGLPSVATPLVPQPADAAACLAELRTNHVEAEIVPSPQAPLADCEIAEPVRVSSIGLANGATIDMPDRLILRLRIRPHFHGVCAGSDGAACYGDAGLGHCRARYRRLPLQQPNPTPERQSEPACQGASPSIFRQSRSPIGDVSPSAMKRIPQKASPQLPL